MPRRKPIPTILGDINCRSATNTKMFGAKKITAKNKRKLNVIDPQ